MVEGAPAITVGAVVAVQAGTPERRGVRLHVGCIGLAMARVTGCRIEVRQILGMTVGATEGLASGQCTVSGKHIAGRVVREGRGVDHGEAGRRAAMLRVTGSAAIRRLSGL